MNVAEFTPHQFVTQERWVADDEVGCGPGGFVGFAFGVVAEDGVCVFEVGEFLEEGFFLVLDAVVVLPLEEADPDDDGGDLVGVEVDLDAEELAGVGDRIEGEGKAMGEAEDAGLVPEVEQALEGDVEEVSGAAGGIEDADGRELGGPVLQEGEGGAIETKTRGALGGCGSGFFGEGVEDGLLDCGPATAEGVHDDGLDEEEDVFGRGVMGADHGAFSGVEGALEEGAEDGGLNGGPVVLGGGVEDAEVGVVKCDEVVVGTEEVAVEVGNEICTEEAVRLTHGLEKDGEHAVEVDGRGAVVSDEAAEGVIGEEADGVCEEAEDEAHEEVRDLLFGGAGSGGALEFELLGEAEKVAGGGLGDAGGGDAGAELVEVAEDVAEDFEWRQSAGGGIAVVEQVV